MPFALFCFDGPLVNLSAGHPVKGLARLSPTKNIGSSAWTLVSPDMLNAKLSATESPTLFATVQNLALSGFVSPAGGCAMQTSIRGSLGTLVL
jgi:hypothetical protein